MVNHKLEAKVKQEDSKSSQTNEARAQRSHDKRRGYRVKTTTDSHTDSFRHAFFSRR